MEIASDRHMCKYLAFEAIKVDIVNACTFKWVRIKIFGQR